MSKLTKKERIMQFVEAFSQPKKIAFVSPDEYQKKYIADLEKVEKFVENFNSYINAGELHVNTALDEIPYLNQKEFDMVKRIASDSGWFLTKSLQFGNDPIIYTLTAK
jgi:hypothetical protein